MKYWGSYDGISSQNELHYAITFQPRELFNRIPMPAKTAFAINANVTKTKDICFDLILLNIFYINLYKNKNIFQSFSKFLI